MEADFYTVGRSGIYTVVQFQTPSLMNPQELERVRGGLFRLVDVDKRDRLVLDFTKVQYFSSQAVGILLVLNKKLTGSFGGGHNLVLCGVGTQLMELLKITRLDRLLTIKSTLKEAVAG